MYSYRGKNVFVFFSLLWFILGFFFLSFLWHVVIYYIPCLHVQAHQHCTAFSLSLWDIMTEHVCKGKRGRPLHARSKQRADWKLSIYGEAAQQEPERKGERCCSQLLYDDMRCFQKQRQRTGMKRNQGDGMPRASPHGRSHNAMVEPMHCKLHSNPGVNHLKGTS